MEAVSGAIYSTGCIGLPWWLRGKEPACQCRRHGFHPWPGKIQRAVEQLSPCSTTIEPVLQGPGATSTAALAPESQPALHRKKSRCSEKPSAAIREWPLPVLHSQRKHPSSNEDPAQPKVNKHS